MPAGLTEAEARIAAARVSEGRVALDLSRLELTSVPQRILDVADRLEGLDLSYNPIAAIPPWIAQCSQLELLSLNGMPIRALPAELANLSRIRLLAMCDIGLDTLPLVVRDLKSLTHLALARNALVTLPEWFGELRNLWSLGLHANRLTSLPESMHRLRRLNSLDLSQNPELRLPPEITARREARAILDYYARTHGIDAREPLNEFKLVLVGYGGVGKTSLVHRLTTGGYQEFPRTQGVNVKPWSIRVASNDVRAHVWDFGGQEILHGTHRFFMSARALYVILINGRAGTEDHDAEYWLSTVRSFAGDAPIIVLRHKAGDYRFELNTRLLREKYGSAIVFLDTDSQTGEGIDALCGEIARLAAAMDGIRDLWPTAWWRVKEELPQLRKDWLPFEDFRNFARERGVADSHGQERLAEGLNTLGIMLSFPGDETLRQFGVLNPQWVTQRIYGVLNDPSLREAGGRISAQAVTKPRGDDPPAVREYLLKLMPHLSKTA